MTEPEYALIPLARLRACPLNPRRHFPEDALAELAASIAAKGILEPLLVRPARAGGANPTYEIAAGERRFRAARQAGLDEVPCIVRQMSDVELLEIAVVENEQRQDVTPLEKAEGYQALLDRGVSLDDLAARVGRSPSTLRAILRLRSLPEQARQALEAGTLSASVAELLDSLPLSASTQRVLRTAGLEEWGQVFGVEAQEMVALYRLSKSQAEHVVTMVRDAVKQQLARTPDGDPIVIEEDMPIPGGRP